MQRHFNLLAIHHAGVRLNRDNLFATVGFSHWLFLLSCVFDCVPSNTVPIYKKEMRASGFLNNLYSMILGEGQSLNYFLFKSGFSMSPPIGQTLTGNTLEGLGSTI